MDESVSAFMGVDFCNSTQPLRFTLRYQLRVQEAEAELGEAVNDTAEVIGGKKQMHEDTLSLEIKPPVGELFQPLNITATEFISKQGEYIHPILTLNWMLW